MTQEDQVFQKHLTDLARQSCFRGIPVYTDFLDLNQQNIFLGCRNKLMTQHYRMYGGYEQAERQMLAFFPDALSFLPLENDFPITCLKISMRNEKFSQPLTHRDYLGTLMSLGIDRSVLGDIVLAEKEAFLFCLDRMAGYLKDELKQVRHTQVLCEICSPEHFSWSPRFERIRQTVSSVRLDALLSAVTGASRTKTAEMIRGGRVYVNARQILSVSYVPKEGDILSVRGTGRFCFLGVKSESRKGRLFIEADKYI